MRMPPWPADATMARWLRALPRLAAVLAVTVGAMALAGWALRLPLLTRLAPALPAMVPNTAVAFVRAGAALWVLAPEGASRWPRRVGHGLALLVVLFGVAVLGAYLTGWRPGFDLWLFGERLAGTGTRFPGRPSPHTAVAFVLVGLALVLLDADRRGGHRPAMVLVPLSAAVAFIALLGYVYQVRYLYQVATGTGMALQTAATFLMLNGGLLACRPDRQPTRTFIASSPGGLLARRLVPALVLVPLGVGAAVALGQAGRLLEPALGTALTTMAMLAALTVVVVVTIRDLDRAELARHAVHEELVEAEERFRGVTDAATDAIVSADLHGRVRSWSQGAERMFGWRAEEVVGGPLTVIIPQRLRAGHQQGLARVRRTGHAKLAGRTVELVALRRDGTEFPVELSIGMWLSKQGPQFSGVVRDITAIEAGRLSLSLEPVAVADVVAEAVSLVRPLAEQHAILVADPAAGCAEHMLGDRQRLKQVLLNLLSNAVKYNRQGGSVQISCARAPGQRLRITVTDTGPGIPTDSLERLFVPFQRLASDQGQVEGTGLGLPLSKRLAEAMGGTLQLTSTPGQGSSFWVELPLAQAPVARADRHQHAPAAEQQEQLDQGGPALTVLCIEDNLSNLQLIEQLLSRRPGVRLISAMRPQLGLDLAGEHHPDLVLLDLHLPDMPGQEVLARLRANPATAQVPVVVLTADAGPGLARRLLVQGARDLLTKPLDVKELLRLLDTIADERQRAG